MVIVDEYRDLHKQPLTEVPSTQEPLSEELTESLRAMTIFFAHGLLEESGGLWRRSEVVY